MVSVAVLLMAVYLYRGWKTGRTPFLGLTGVLAVWAVLFFTDYWHPVLYLLMADASHVVRAARRPQNRLPSWRS